ncbi:MAG: hypothetical protein KatS3mg119_0583 [Rhodothalassiaceae bacterium]|nr:MAG: hypothetical protein KatS3mg119_0583 [Rhodothalassiaceae bacterium]
MRVSVSEARKRLKELIASACRGEEVVIAADGPLLVRLEPVRCRPFRVGILKDRMSGPGPDFLAEMGEDEIRLWEGDDA